MFNLDLSHGAMAVFGLFLALILPRLGLGNILSFFKLAPSNANGVPAIPGGDAVNNVVDAIVKAVLNSLLPSVQQAVATELLNRQVTQSMALLGPQALLPTASK